MGCQGHSLSGSEVCHISLPSPPHTQDIFLLLLFYVWFVFPALWVVGRLWHPSFFCVCLLVWVLLFVLFSCWHQQDDFFVTAVSSSTYTCSTLRSLKELIIHLCSALIVDSSLLLCCALSHGAPKKYRLFLECEGVLLTLQRNRWWFCFEKRHWGKPKSFKTCVMDGWGSWTLQARFQGSPAGYQCFLVANGNF